MRRTKGCALLDAWNNDCGEGAWSSLYRRYEIRFSKVGANSIGHSRWQRNFWYKFNSWSLSVSASSDEHDSDSDELSSLEIIICAFSNNISNSRNRLPRLRLSISTSVAVARFSMESKSLVKTVPTCIRQGINKRMLNQNPPRHRHDVPEPCQYYTSYRWY